MARPRSFDEAEAVGAALSVFLSKGYDGASISDLTAAMGINPPSLYAAFGDKQGLFRRAMDLYASRRSPLLEAALAAPDIGGVIDRLLHQYADALTDPESPPGCLYVQGALSCSASAAPIKDELAARRLAIEPELERRFEAARNAAELEAGADCRALARYVAALLQGMAVQASGGVGRSELHALATVAAAQFRASIRDTGLPRDS
jgi:AcrR family transcriptional regulator